MGIGTALALGAASGAGQGLAQAGTQFQNYLNQQDLMRQSANLDIQKSYAINEQNLQLMMQRFGVAENILNQTGYGGGSPAASPVDSPSAGQAQPAPQGNAASSAGAPLVSDPTSQSGQSPQAATPASQNPPGLVGSAAAGISPSSPTPNAQTPAAPAQQPQPPIGSPPSSGYFDPHDMYMRGQIYNMMGLPGGTQMMSMALDHDPNIAARMPTDLMKYVGILNDPNAPLSAKEMAAGAIQKANYIAPTAMRSPFFYDPQTQSVKPVDPSILTPGYEAMYKGEAAGKAAFTPQRVWNQDANGGKGGYVVVPLSTAIQAANGGAQPTSGNNPGNLEVPGKPGQFQQFQSPTAGLAAMDNQLALYGKRGINTVESLVHTYAPNGDGNNNEANYASFLRQQLHLQPGQPIDLNNPVQRQLIGSNMIMMEKGPGAIFSSSQSAQGGPMASEPPPGYMPATDTSQTGPSKQMSEQMNALAGGDSVYQQSRTSLQQMIDLAQHQGALDTAARFLPDSAASKVNTDAAEYQKAHANFVSLQGKSLGSGATDSARETIDESVPDFGKPQAAKIAGLTNQMNQLDLNHLKRQVMTPVFQTGNEKAFTALSAQFDNTVKPTMMPQISQLITMPPGPARGAALKAAVADPQMNSALNLLVGQGMLK